jgi:hypothetical protein
MLMARRLCEAGYGFVTVTSRGWDMHGNAFGIDDGMPILGPAVDKADKLVGQPAEDLVTPNMLLGTVMNTLFDPGQVRLMSSIPDDVKKAVIDSKPIPQLV